MKLYNREEGKKDDIEDVWPVAFNPVVQEDRAQAEKEKVQEQSPKK